MVGDYLYHLYDMVPYRVCDQLIECLERSDQLIHRDNGPQDFYELNINQAHPEVVQPLSGILLGVYKKYCELVRYTSYLPEPSGLEEFRVKRYIGGTGQQFDDHVDVGDLTSCKRYLSFLFYLNDDFTGGETIFYPDTTMIPRKGSVVVFPPTWQYPHAGLPVNVGTKYIMSSYLNYT